MLKRGLRTLCDPQLLRPGRERKSLSLMMGPPTTLWPLPHHLNDRESGDLHSPTQEPPRHVTKPIAKAEETTFNGWMLTIFWRRTRSASSYPRNAAPDLCCRPNGANSCTDTITLALFRPHCGVIYRRPNGSSENLRTTRTCRPPRG